ncbi:MAG TPA: hypothetical protein VKX17_24095 [Planctomycetota bacterium]|nr:hypothetical protein [Planctomycetota bacterium]
MLESITRDQFAQRLNTKFRLTREGAEAIELELISVSELKVLRSGKKSFENFSLMFCGPKESLLPQKSYAFQHDALGAFDLFIVPLGVDETGVQYQAVFNRMAG